MLRRLAEWILRDDLQDLRMHIVRLTARNTALTAENLRLRRAADE